MIDNDVTYDLNSRRGHLTYLRYIGCTFIIVIDRVDGGKGEYGEGGRLFWVVGKSPSGSLSMMKGNALTFMMIPRSMIGHLFVTHRSNNTE